MLAVNCLDKLASFFRNSPDMKTRIPLVLITFALVCFALVQNTRAVLPAPDGCYPAFTTAEGCNALFGLGAGQGNTGIGWYSLFLVGGGNFNTGVGAGTLVLNTADSNTAVGAAAMLLNTIGTLNTAVGTDALVFNDTGGENTANGAFALSSNNAGSFNTAIGYEALFNNTTGTGNIALGASAGGQITIGSGNIDIGNPGGAESSTIRIGLNQTKTFIAGINGVPVTGTAVVVDGSGQLGVAPSSKRFKEQIKPMDNESETILALKPVTFHYKKQIDPKSTAQFGLVAEEVERVNPDLVVRDDNGKIYTVRYDAVNAMLLNEFLKEHQTVQELKKQVAELTAGLQKMSAQLARGESVRLAGFSSKAAPQTVLNDQ